MSNSYEHKINDWVTIVATLNHKKDHSDLEELMKYKKGLEYFGEARFDLYRKSINSNIKIGSFCLSPMPGCCGIVVIHGMYLTEQTRGTGLSDHIRQLKVDLCKALGYSMMIATTRMDQIPAVGNIMKSKYRIVKTFKNKRTDNLIGIALKDI